jgi:hypothetical protein
MDRAGGKQAAYRAMPHRSKLRQSCGSLTIAALVIACIAFFATEALAQCTARDVQQNRLTLKASPSANTPAKIGSASDVPVWRTIAIGTFANSFALLTALDAAGCGIGGLAEEVLARPAFSVRTAKADVDLFAVSAAELGLTAATAPLADILARAQRLGFGLAPPEVAPQLRLQYLDQPIGELVVGMEPIKTWTGEPVILSVANGGAGLVLIGRDGSAEAPISMATRFVFVRSNEAVLAKSVHRGR